MMNKTCKNVFTSLKKASRKFDTKKLNKKHGLVKFYKSAKSMSKSNKDVFNALESASKKVKPYTHVEKNGLVHFFHKAQKNYKGKTCKKGFTALNKTAKAYSKKPKKVNQKMLTDFYAKAEKKYLH